MVQSTFDAASQYYSGQGVLMIGSRDANGNPTGLRPVGNVTDLKINIATTIVSHKGSQNGQRAIDARLQTETNPTVSFTMDSFIQANLAKALRGSYTTLPAGTVSSEACNVYPGLVTALQHINVAAVALTTVLGSTALVAYTDAVTPWDFKVNLNAGSIEMNDGSLLPFSALGLTPTAVTVGTTTAFTMANGFAVGDTVYISGVTGADAALVNNLKFTVTAASGTGFSIGLNTTGKTLTITGTPKVVDLNATIPVTAAYTFLAQNVIDSLTQPLTDNYLRFEGLNTVDGNAPVIVEIFRFQNDPLKELALLSDTFGVMTIEGTILTDSTRQSGSPYFHVRQGY